MSISLKDGGNILDRDTTDLESSANLKSDIAGYSEFEGGDTQEPAALSYGDHRAAQIPPSPCKDPEKHSTAQTGPLSAGPEPEAPYYLTKVWPGADTAYVSLVGSSAALCMNIVGFVAGRVADRHGFKVVLYTSAVVAWLGLFCAAFCTEVWQLFITQGIISGIGQGMALPLAMSLPSQWFYRRRGFASGVAMGGAGLGGGISTLIVRQLLTAVGLRKTLIVVSCVNLGVSLLATSLIRTRPSSPEAQGRGRGPWVDKVVPRSSIFWSITLSMLVATLGYAVPFIYLAQWMAVFFPQTLGVATAVPTTLLAFSVCFGRALVGFAADQLGPFNTYILVFFLSAAVQFCLWLTARSFAAVCVFAIAYGLVAPGYIGLLPQIVVKVFGPTNLASNVGLILLFNGPGNFASPPLAGAIFDSSGRHTFTWIIVAAGSLQVAGGILACLARLQADRRWLARV
ncbi:hypothetical protein JCM24511_07226 [Saitozyma sp. JCM 24511]|nr:hypothetical protein JCM24511_07226 [Saitozyma sp. JCM 24511]